MNKDHPATVVAHPPLGQTIKIVGSRPVQDRRFRIDSANVKALVKVVKMGNIQLFGERYFLSDDIGDPGIEPLFLMHSKNPVAIGWDYVTNGCLLWSTLHSLAIPGPTVIGRSFEVTHAYWEMTHNDMNKIRKAIKCFAESL